MKAGRRGPTLLSDPVFRDKISHFDHERIPGEIDRFPDMIRANMLIRACCTCPW